MLHIQQPTRAQAYRRKAAMCTDYAQCARTDADRGQLLQMRDAWLARAANEDGPPPTPPGRAVAVAVPR